MSDILVCDQVEGPLHLTLQELDDTHCRFPFGDSPFTFCGQPRSEGSSYCPEHHTLCWMPAKDRRA